MRLELTTYSMASCRSSQLSYARRGFWSAGAVFCAAVLGVGAEYGGLVWFVKMFFGKPNRGL